MNFDSGRLIRSIGSATPEQLRAALREVVGVVAEHTPTPRPDYGDTEQDIRCREEREEVVLEVARVLARGLDPTAP